MDKKKKNERSPSEKKALQKGVQVAIHTDNLLLGALAANNDKNYDLKKNRLK